MNGEAPDASAQVNGVTPAAEAPAEEPAKLPTEPSFATSQEWVDVPRPEEITSAAESTPAELTPAASQSWADDHPETTEVCLHP